MTDKPFAEEECGECGKTEEVCPDCGERFVTPLEPESGRVSKGLRRWVQEADDGDTRTFTNLCWKCGWEDRRTITVEVEEEHGEAS
jgi:hypothetical protein